MIAAPLGSAIFADDEPLTEEDFAEGFFSFDDLQADNIVTDRSDLHRKQKRYGFPRAVKLGDRQARFFRRRVRRWLARRAALGQSQH